HLDGTVRTTHLQPLLLARELALSLCHRGATHEGKDRAGEGCVSFVSFAAPGAPIFTDLRSDGRVCGRGSCESWQRHVRAGAREGVSDVPESYATARMRTDQRRRTNPPAASATKGVL